MVQTYHQTFHTLNYCESEINLYALTDTILGVIFYLGVVLEKQISTFTITEIFLKISNLQHVSPK